MVGEDADGSIIAAQRLQLLKLYSDFIQKQETADNS